MSKVSVNKYFQFLIQFAPEILILIGFCIVQSILLNNDFWNDELYTLDKFTFVPVAQTLTDYHVPNNHVFFNLINNLYLKIIGINSLNNLIETPWKLRVIPLLYSFFTLIITYKIGREFFSRKVGILATVILITTIPFFSYSLQIRGYGLSTLLLVFLVYLVFSYSKKQKIKYLIGVLLSTCFLLYTIPSNAYFVLCLLVILDILAAIYLYNHRHLNLKNSFFNPYTKLLITMIIGVGIALLLFLPIFYQVFHNEYVTRGDSFQFWKLDFYFSHVFEGGFSGKTLLITTSIGALILINFFKKEWRKFSFVFISLIIFPFFIPYVLGDDPPIRVFVVSMPFFSLYLAMSIVLCFTFLIKEKKYHKGIIIGTIAYCFIIFVFEISTIQKQTLNDIETADRSHSLYRQFHTFRYQPLADMKSFSKIYESNKLPVKIVGCESYGIPYFLKHEDIPFTENSDNLGAFLELHDSCYLVTSRPNSFEEFKDYNFEILSDKLTYHTVLKVSKK